MTNKKSPLSYALLLCCMGCCLSARAEPTITPQTEIDAEAAPTAAIPDAAQNKSVIVDPSAAAHVPNPSNTIQMLLDLQAEPEASASGSGRSAARQGGTRSAAQATQAPAGNPFGRGDNPFGASPEFVRPAPSLVPGAPGGGVEWRAAPAGGNFSGVYGGATGITTDQPLVPSQRHATSASSDASDERWWMPSALIRWVREHRQEVLIGAAVALALAWASAARGSQRRS